MLIRSFMILIHFDSFPEESYSWTSKFIRKFCQNPGKAFTPRWPQDPLAVLLLLPVSIARCIPTASLVFTSIRSLISSTERELQYLSVLSNTWLFWICIHFTFFFTIFLKNMQLKNFMLFFLVFFLSYESAWLRNSHLSTTIFHLQHTALFTHQKKKILFLRGCLPACLGSISLRRLFICLHPVLLFENLSMYFWYKLLMIQTALWASSAFKPYILQTRLTKMICLILSKLSFSIY